MKLKFTMRTYIHRLSGKLLLQLFIAAFCVLLPGIVLSQNTKHNPRVGKTAGIVNLVIGDNLDELRQLSIDDPVYALERISAELDSHGEILLDDNSRILVGPGAEISLDDFVVANSGIQSGTLNILKGAFRFVSGNSPKGTFKVITPLSTIGIRGTFFDVYVNEKGQTDVIIYSGSVQVCTLANRCRDLHRTCDIVRVTSKYNIGQKKFLRSGNKTQENERYSLIENQARFSKELQAPIDSCDSRGAAAKATKGGLGDEGNDPDEPSGRGSGKDPGVSTSF